MKERELLLLTISHKRRETKPSNHSIWNLLWFTHDSILCIADDDN